MRVRGGLDTQNRVYCAKWTALPLIVGFMCASFTAAASFLLAGLLHCYPDRMNSALWTTTLIKGFFFSIVSAGIGLLLYVKRAQFRFICLKANTPPPRAKHNPLPYLLWLLIFIGIVFFPRLNAYPWIAPDEAHHLSVAKNLALHHLYASGNPESGYRCFDTYDSVGVPVIGLTAMVHEFLGITPAVARGVVAFYYLLLCIGLFLLFLPSGPLPVTCGILLATFGYGTIYLGRTFYGEIPALTFLVWGLLAWRHAFSTGNPCFWGGVAGGAFGLAILCKTILILSAFAFLAVLIWDRITEKRLHLPHLLCPAFGVLGMLGIWAVIQHLATHEAVPPPRDTLGLYQHYLMFGWRSPLNALARFKAEPFQTLFLMITLFYGLFPFVRQTRDPARILLVFMAYFYLFWWLFFTPCQIYRYSWWSYWIGGGLCGIMLGRLSDRLKFHGRVAWRTGMGLLMLFLCASIVPDAVRELRQIYSADENQDEYAVAAYLEHHAQNKKLLTTYYPLGMTLGYLNQRHVETIKAVPALIPSDTWILILVREQAALPAGHQPDEVFGKYALLKGGTTVGR